MGIFSINSISFAPLILKLYLMHTCLELLCGFTLLLLYNACFSVIYFALKSTLSDINMLIFLYFDYYLNDTSFNSIWSYHYVLNFCFLVGVLRSIIFNIIIYILGLKFATLCFVFCLFCLIFVSVFYFPYLWVGTWTIFKSPFWFIYSIFIVHLCIALFSYFSILYIHISSLSMGIMIFTSSCEV